MGDTLKVATGGSTVSALTWMNWLPEVISILVGILTAVYIGIKIYKEVK